MTSFAVSWCCADTSRYCFRFNVSRILFERIQAVGGGARKESPAPHDALATADAEYILTYCGPLRAFSIFYTAPRHGSIMFMDVKK
jgi:hypothetical protein